MIHKHIQLAAFRVVAYIKGECVELPQFPRVSDWGGATNIRTLKEGLVFSDVLWYS